MLEQAQVATKQGKYECVRYTRFADDQVILVSNHPKARHWADTVERRLREELEKLDLSINEEKTKTVDFSKGEPFDFLGYTFRWVPSRTRPGKMMVLKRPQKKKRTRFLRDLKATLRKRLHRPVQEVIRYVVNPKVRGWVNYFRWGNSGSDLSFVRWQVDKMVRQFASRQRPKRRGGRTWTKWRHEELYEEWRLFSNYRVLPWQQRPESCVT